VQESGWTPGPVWTGAENLAPTGIRSPDRPNRSQSLYRLSYRVHVETCRSVIICEIIVRFLVIVQDNKRCMVQRIEITSEYVNPVTELYIPRTPEIWTIRVRQSPTLARCLYLRECHFYLPRSGRIILTLRSFRYYHFVLHSGDDARKNISSVSCLRKSANSNKENKTHLSYCCSERRSGASRINRHMIHRNEH